jgi:hypothetical protein
MRVTIPCLGCGEAAVGFSLSASLAGPFSSQVFRVFFGLPVAASQ